jgi:hypothetical protein
MAFAISSAGTSVVGGFCFPAMKSFVTILNLLFQFLSRIVPPLFRCITNLALLRSSGIDTSVVS